MGRRLIDRIILIVIMVMVFMSQFLTVTVGAENKEQRETIKVGYFLFDGYHMMDEEGNKSGYGYDILQKMRVYENWNYDYIGDTEEANWNDMLSMLESGEIDFVTSATKNEEREKKFDFSTLSIGTSATRIVVKAGNNTYSNEDYHNWDGIKVGLIENNSRNDSFADYAEKHGFYYEPIYLNDQDVLNQALEDGAVDMIVTSNLLNIDHVWTIDQFDDKPFYVIVKKGNKKLLTQINEALFQLENDEPSFANTLYAKYYNLGNDGQLSFSKEEQEYIKRVNEQGIVFRAVINPDRKPLSYYEDGEMKGMLVDACRWMFDITGLQVEFIPTKTREEYMEQIYSEKNTFVCDFTNDYSTAENLGYVLTSSYFSSSFSKLMRKDWTETKKPVRALVNSSITNSVIRKYGKDGNNYYYDTTRECVEAVLHGDADYVDMYTRNAQEYIFEDQTNALTCAVIPDMNVSFSIAINSGENACLSSIIQKSINNDSKKILSQISEEYTFYDHRGTTLIGLIYEYPLVVLFVVLLVVVTLFGSFFMILLQRKRKNERVIYKKLEVALQNAEAANQAKTSFLSRISHDMRTPLNGILGISNLIEKEVANPVIKKDILDLQLSGQYLLNLINDTLDMSRIESGKLELHPEVCDGKDILKNSIQMVRSIAIQKNITLDITDQTITDHTTERMLYVDVGRMQQMFMNVVGNAIKFSTENGTVWICVREVSEENGCLNIEIVVRDAGIGIKAEFLPKLFEAFAQEDESRKNTNNGTGLGLAITKSIIDKMGGEISVESELGKGSTFTMLIPMPIATKEQLVDLKKDNTINDNVKNLDGKRILLCEDHTLNASIVERLLNQKGMHVEHAENGKIGLELFIKAHAYYYDAILMDIRMPEMDGIEATKQIRKSDKDDAKTIPIIAITANTMTSDVEEIKEAGMNAHIAKPIIPEVMYETISFLLKNV